VLSFRFHHRALVLEEDSKYHLERCIEKKNLYLELPEFDAKDIEGLVETVKIRGSTLGHSGLSNLSGTASSVPPSVGTPPSGSPTPPRHSRERRQSSSSVSRIERGGRTIPASLSSTVSEPRSLRTENWVTGIYIPGTPIGSVDVVEARVGSRQDFDETLPSIQESFTYSS